VRNNDVGSICNSCRLKNNSTGYHFLKILLTCFASIAILLICHTVYARASYYEMRVSVGFDNQAKYGRYVPVIIDLYSEENFDGILSFIAKSESGGEQVASYPVTLKGGKWTTIRTYISLFVKSNNISFSLKNLSGEELQYKNVKLDVFEDDYTKLFIGVISNNAHMTGLFDDINLGEYSDITFPFIFTESFSISVDDISGDLLYMLDCLDIIIVTTDIWLELSNEQISALTAWAASGKTLLIEYNDMLTGELRKLCQVALAAKAPDDELRPGLWACSIDYDAGRLGFIVPAPERDFFSYTTTDDNELLGLILCKACTLDVINAVIDYDMYYTNYDDSYAVEYMLKAVHGKDVPNITEYIIVIVIYVILVGPVLYFILKSIRKLKYLMPFIIIISAFFSFRIYKMSESTRFTDIFFQYANIVSINDEKVEEKIYFSTNIPYNDTYYMKFDSDYEVEPLLRMRAVGEAEDYLEILYDETAAKVTLKKSVPFSKEYFTATNLDSDVNEWDIDINVTYFDGRINGNIVNNTGKDLTDTALILYDKIILTGDIKINETKELGAMKLLTLPYYSSDVADMVVKNDRIVSDEITSKNKTLSKEAGGRTAVIDYIISKYFSDKSDTPVFIGFAADEAELTSDYEAYGYTAFCKETEISTVIGNLMFEPVNYKNVINIDDSNYDAYSNTTYSLGVRLQYNFDDIESLFRIRFDCGIEYDTSVTDVPYYDGFSGSVYFYNYSTLEYDEIDISKKYFDISEIKDYLIETQNGGYSLMVRYNVDTEGGYHYKEIKMPRVSAIRRLNNAESTESE